MELESARHINDLGSPRQSGHGEGRQNQPTNPPRVPRHSRNASSCERAHRRCVWIYLPPVSMCGTAFWLSRFRSVRLRADGAGRQAAMGNSSDGQGKGWQCMLVILAQPRGFCAGVERAVEIVELALKKYD